MFLDCQSIDKIPIIYQKELNLFKKEVWFLKTVTNVHDIYKITHSSYADERKNLIKISFIYFN